MKLGSKILRLILCIVTLDVEDKGVKDADESTAKLDALVAERDSLRAEVSEIRKSLESFQEKHETEISDLRNKLFESKKEKDAAEASYKNLLGKVNQIKAQLGERLKADAVGKAQFLTLPD